MVVVGMAGERGVEMPPQMVVLAVAEVQPQVEVGLVELVRMEVMEEEETHSIVIILVVVEEGLVVMEGIVERIIELVAQQVQVFQLY